MKGRITEEITKITKETDRMETKTTETTWIKERRHVT